MGFLMGPGSKAVAFSTEHLVRSYYGLKTVLTAYKQVQGQVWGQATNAVT